MVQSGCNFIQNRWVEGHGEEFTKIGSTTGKVLWKGFAASPEDVVYAIKAAREAFPTWSNLALEDRLIFLERFRKKLVDSKEDFAKTISSETGKPLWESALEVGAMVNKVSISIEAYNERCPNKEIAVGNKNFITRHRPHGVVVVLGPFNFPGHLPNGHIVPALLAGNTVVFKPSEQTPLVAQKLCKLWEVAGLPAGVLNMIHGDGVVGQILSIHPDVDGLFFTGSWRTGRQFAAFYGRMPNKILALEMGGNNPLVVSKIKDIEAAIYTTIQSAYITSGQRCTCARRLIVINNSKSKAYIKGLIAAIKEIRVGLYIDRPEPFMGPVISMASKEHLLTAQEWLINMGGKSLVKMTDLRNDIPLISPGLMDVSSLTDKMDEEIFGPFLQLTYVDSLDGAVQEANRTSYGLSAAILTDDPEEYEHFRRNIKVGIVNWNAQTTGASSAMPFGGVGNSGNYRPSAFYAADYCAYPVVSVESSHVTLPDELSPGITLPNSVRLKSKKKPK